MSIQMTQMTGLAVVSLGLASQSTMVIPARRGGMMLSRFPWKVALSSFGWVALALWHQHDKLDLKTDQVDSEVETVEFMPEPVYPTAEARDAHRQLCRTRMKEMVQGRLRRVAA
eukprot:gnl/MRDRNA2_/MRDRNA2_352228_c0_seq1.p1 gnl/MRDRNA2_/MRDRNA2_352228_c0~~gnl/MRDRNA2_/MRDRNA2_352228_c0_seq1.p1  ORF type:complete len:114 (+),score=18.55 gnl/MRDRNA2_/MRDRNA2_352228_c0_seq1:1-342(+)